MRRERFAVSALIVLGAVLVIGAAALAIMRSFSFLAVASTGLFVIAAALIIRAFPAPWSAAAALMAVAGIVLLVVGMVATPVYYLGWGLLAGASATALLAARRSGV